MLRITFLRVFPSSDPHDGISRHVSDILSDILSGILCGILSAICSGPGQLHSLRRDVAPGPGPLLRGNFTASSTRA